MTAMATQAEARLQQRRTALRQSLAGGGPATREALAHELAETDAALERIAHGQFGRCESCGGAIGRQRLLALPAARLCIGCTAKSRRSEGGIAVHLRSDEEEPRVATKEIDFEKLSLQQALDLAVLIEEEARERYEEFAHQMRLHRSDDAARFFRFMAANEDKHRTELLARRRDLFPGAAWSVTREMLFDVEAPDYDEVRAFMTARQALEIALRAEEKAHAFFVAALPAVRDDRVRALFEELRDEEVEHQELVRKQLRAAPPDPDLGADNFVDDPVSQ